MRTDRVRLVIAPWFFRLPRLRRYQGYALIRTILLRRIDASDVTYLTTRYRENPYELEARRAVELDPVVTSVRAAQNADLGCR